MYRRWDKEKRVQYIKNVEWCKENNLTLDFRRGDLHIYDNEGNLLIQGDNLNKAVKKLQKKQKNQSTGSQ